MTSEPWLHLIEDRPQPRPHQWLRDPLGLRAGPTSLRLSCLICGMGSRRDYGHGARGIAWWGWGRAPE